MRHIHAYINAMFIIIVNNYIIILSCTLVYMYVSEPFKGNNLKLAASLDELEVAPTRLKVTEKTLDALIFHHLQCRYKEFVTPRITKAQCSPWM